jgi:hypothetical protein
VIAGFLGIAAFDSNSREALSVSGVLRAMQDQTYGGTLLGIAALGLIAFGCFEIIEAAVRSTYKSKLKRQPRSAA